MAGPRYFERTPRAGLPLAMTGVADGLAKIENALRNIMFVGGQVHYTAKGVPVLMIDESVLQRQPAPEYGVLEGTPTHVLGRDSSGNIGWVEVVTHESQHPTE